MEVIIYDTNKYYRERRWAAELRKGRGWEVVGDVVFKTIRWDLYPHSPKCPILRAFRQADLSTPYSLWKILSSLFKQLIFYLVDRDSRWLRNCIKKRCLLTNFPARLIFGAHDSTDIRKLSQVSKLQFYSSKLYQETYSSKRFFVLFF